MSKSHIYIKKFNSSPLTCEISFYQTLSREESTENDSNTILSIVKRLGLSFSTIEQAPIKINALELENVFGKTDDITFILKDQYLYRLKKNFLSILGASSLLGNPI
jgi:hypothetical protein